MASFNNLTPADQEEYMKLHNRFEEKLSDNLLPNDLFKGMEDGAETQAYTNQVLKVYGIYQTNNFDDGVSIKISRLVVSVKNCHLPDPTHPDCWYYTGMVP